ncbi:MAG TPA: DUF4114 domain-containing protein [Cyclobacteriaceae bacterium]
MKNRPLWSLLLVISVVACHDNKMDERPDNIIDTIPCPTLYSRILELFPENVEIKQKVLFTDSAQKKIVLNQASQVYVTYLAEGAGYRNSVAWYSYNKNSPPSSPDKLQLNVLFPDVSSDILHPGDRLKLQDDQFPAGTVIGFVLIINGWQGKVDFNRQKLYTDYQFNPNQRQQHILFQEKTCGALVLAFEDNTTVNDKQDADYNDIIFTVEDNNTSLENTKFDETKLISW